MTDLYLFWVAHLNLRVTFQSHIRFARKVQKYGDAFSKSSSIYCAVYTGVGDLSVWSILYIAPLLPVYPGAPKNQRQNSKKQRTNEYGDFGTLKYGYKGGFFYQFYAR